MYSMTTFWGYQQNTVCPVVIQTASTLKKSTAKVLCEQEQKHYCSVIAFSSEWYDVNLNKADS